jgi:hypothetical protein
LCFTGNAISISENIVVALNDMVMDEFEMVCEKEGLFQSAYDPVFA